MAYKTPAINNYTKQTILTIQISRTNAHMNQTNNFALRSEYLECSLTVSEDTRSIIDWCRVPADRWHATNRN